MMIAIGLSRTGTLLSLAALAALTIAQIALRRQRRPVFTTKAITVTATAGVLTLAAAVVLLWTGRDALLPFLVLLQPVSLAGAWLLWFPADALLKYRVMASARALRKKFPHLVVIGVTGSVGKTTTKELLGCVLSDLHPTVTPAHVNTEMGVAQWLGKVLRSKSVPHVLVIEMGAYRKGEIARLCWFTQPELGVVTYVGMQHVALFGSHKNLFETKAELVQALPLDGRAFVNGDSAPCREMTGFCACPVTIVGTGGPCDLEAFDIEETAKGIRFSARHTAFELPMHGTHTVTNVLLAIAVAEHLGIKTARIQELLKGFSPLSSTFSVRAERGVRVLDDTHNSSAASLKAAIAWARTQPEKHKIFLTTGLIEMGEFQAPAEQELGALSSAVFERIIVIDPVSAKNFTVGGAKAEAFAPHAAKVPAGALLVCAGRMPRSTIVSLLPS
jgi:UDP-N-acetylmuramoyl-tripeptide--D-alanyl-D-alanine ligase